MEVPAPEGAWSGCGEQEEEEEEDRVGESSSLETPPRASLATAPSPLYSRNSGWSPTPRRAQAAPRPCPPAPTHQRRARALPGGKLPRWPGVNRHSGQRPKGKASHKAGRCGSRGLVSRSPAEPSCEKRPRRPGGRPSVPAGLAGPAAPAAPCGQDPPKWQAAPARSIPSARSAPAHAHTLTRTPARPPARQGEVVPAPAPRAALSRVQRPHRRARPRTGRELRCT